MVQINEVTNRFRNGWVHLWVGVNAQSTLASLGVKPEDALIVRRVVVR